MKIPYPDALRRKLNTKSLRSYVGTLGIRTKRFLQYVKNAAEVAYIDERFWIIVQMEDGESAEFFLTLEEMQVIPELEPYAAAAALELSGGVTNVEFDDDGGVVASTTGTWDPRHFDLWTMKEDPDDVH